MLINYFFFSRAEVLVPEMLLATSKSRAAIPFYGKLSGLRLCSKYIHVKSKSAVKAGCFVLFCSI